MVVRTGAVDVQGGATDTMVTRNWPKYLDECEPVRSYVDLHVSRVVVVTSIFGYFVFGMRF